MPRFRRYDETKSEDLILQDAMLRSMVHEGAMRAEFKESLRVRLAHGSYYEPERDGDAGTAVTGPLPAVQGLLAWALRLRRLSPLARFAGLACVYVLPVLLVLGASPMLSRDTSLSAIAAELCTTLSTRGNLYYEVMDTYVNRMSGERISMLWRVWRAPGGYLYVERRDGDAPSQREIRFYARPEGEILLDDREGSVRETEYHGQVSEAERRALTDIVAPLVAGSGQNVVSSFMHSPVAVAYSGKQTVGGRVCKAYTSGDGLQVWVDSEDSGYLKVRDTTGVTADPAVMRGTNGRQWAHTLEVSNVQRGQSIAALFFVPSVPDGYRVIESREVYSTVERASDSLGFKENLPGELWSSFEKPRAYVVSSGAGDAQLQVVLFRKDQYHDSLNAILFSQYRPAPLFRPVRGFIRDKDAPMAKATPEFESGSTYSWVTNGLHFRTSVRVSGEYSDPDMSQVFSAVQANARFMPKL